MKVNLKKEYLGILLIAVLISFLGFIIKIIPQRDGQTYIILFSVLMFAFLVYRLLVELNTKLVIGSSEVSIKRGFINKVIKREDLKYQSKLGLIYINKYIFHVKDKELILNELRKLYPNGEIK